MTNLTNKYAGMIAEMKKDALQNLEEASVDLEKQQTQKRECQENIDELKVRKVNTFKQFFEIGKSLIALFIQRKADPQVVAELIEPCNEFIAAAGAIPEMQEQLSEIQFKEKEAKQVFETAQKDVNIIDYFC